MTPACDCWGLQTLSWSGQGQVTLFLLPRSYSRRWCPLTAWALPGPKVMYPAPTIHATITQVNNVANRVITTCLRILSMMAQDRARVVEHRIQVAQICCGRPRSPSQGPWGLPLLLSMLSGLKSVVSAPAASTGPSCQEHADIDPHVPLVRCSLPTGLLPWLS